MNAKLDDVAVDDNEVAQRYEAHVDGRLALIAYQRAGDHIALVHTEVPEELEGRGLAGHMARVALEDARTRGLAVIPSCPFVADYIRRHPQYTDLVPLDERGRFLGVDRE